MEHLIRNGHAQGKKIRFDSRSLENDCRNRFVETIMIKVVAMMMVMMMFRACKATQRAA